MASYNDMHTHLSFVQFIVQTEHFAKKQSYYSFKNCIVKFVLGFAANAHYTHTGGGTNYQCLPPNPQYNKYYTGTSWVGSWLSGTEYQDHSNGNIFLHGTYNQNVPCTRCYTKRRGAVMMYPARRICPAGWTMEYEGC